MPGQSADGPGPPAKQAEMGNWRFACDQRVAVFYNPASETQVVLEHEEGSYFDFRLGNRKARIVFRCLSCIDNSGTSGESLITMIKSGNASSVTESDVFGVWAYDIEGSNIVFTIKGFPDDKLVLVNDGFIYFASQRALVARGASETFMSAARARAILEDLDKQALTHMHKVKVKLLRLIDSCSTNQYLCVRIFAAADFADHVRPSRALWRR